MNLDDTVHRVIEIINSAEIKWWLDSGTLLGFIREDAIISWDNDIDLSVFIEDENSLELLLRYLDNEKFILKKYYYQGKVFKLKILYKKISLDIQVFRRYNDQLISHFAYYGAKPNTNRNSLVNLVYRSNSLLLLKALEKNMHSKHVINISTLKLFLCARVGTWVYNISDILPLKSLQNLNLPNNYTNFLSFRYGSWQDPNKDWDSYSMDGARKY